MISLSLCLTHYHLSHLLFNGLLFLSFSGVVHAAVSTGTVGVGCVLVLGVCGKHEAAECCALFCCGL